MQRTQIYISEDQARRLADEASDAGVSKAEIVRRILDRGLGLSDDIEQRRRALSSTAGILPKAPDWPAWLASVRSGRDAGDRIATLHS